MYSPSTNGNHSFSPVILIDLLANSKISEVTKIPLKPVQSEQYLGLTHAVNQAYKIVSIFSTADLSLAHQCTQRYLSRINVNDSAMYTFFLINSLDFPPFR